MFKIILFLHNHWICNFFYFSCPYYVTEWCALHRECNICSPLCSTTNSTFTLQNSYGTFSENHSESIQNGSASRLHCLWRTGPDRSKPFHSVNACIPVLINNHYFEWKHTSCEKNTPPKLSPEYVFVCCRHLSQSFSQFLLLCPSLGIQCILHLASTIICVTQNIRMLLLLTTMFSVSSLPEVRVRPRTA